MLRTSILLLFFAFLHQVSSAQTSGDYRSAQSGDWSAFSTWERYDGTAWVSVTFPAEPPNYNFGVITITEGHEVTLQTVEVDQVVINGTLIIDLNQVANLRGPVSPSDVITVNEGGILNVKGSIPMTTNTIIRVKSGGTVIASDGLSITGSSATNLFFEGGSTYQHSYTSTSGTIPLATWDETSTCLIAGYTNTTPPTNLNQDFGNVTFNLPVENGALSLNGQLNSVRGNFSITSLKTVNLASVTPYTLTVGGDFILNAGTILVNTTAAGVNNEINISGSYIQTGGNLNLINGGNTILNISKDFTWTSGSISKSLTGNGTIVFNGSGLQLYNNANNTVFAGGINFSVLNGSILDLGETSITGSGSFTLNSGATLRLGSTNPTGALVNSTDAGNIRVSSPLRTYNSGSTIIYNGLGAQTMGNGQPSAAAVTTIIDNVQGVELGASATINGNLTLTNGDFDISQHSITLGGIFTPNENQLIADGITSLTITDDGATADFGLLKFSGTTQIGNLTIDGNRNVQLGANLTVSDMLTLTAGDLQLNGFTLNLQGGISQSGGALTSTSESRMVISSGGSGSLPTDLLIGGGSIQSIAMNRLGETLTTSSNLVVDSLNLVAGTFTHTGTVSMTEDGVITVATGVLTTPVEAVSGYNVVYNGNENIDTGAELPTTGTMLQDLTNASTAAVMISSDVTINGSLILDDGIFNTNGFQVTLAGDFVSNAASNFFDPESSTISTTVFDGNTSISGNVTPQLGTVVVNSTKALSIAGNLQVNVAGNFTMNGSFNAGTSTVLLNGNTEQILSGSFPISFYGLRVNKTDTDVTIQSAVNIIDVLNVQTATTVNAGNNLLTLVSNASRTARVNPLLAGADIVGSVIVERYLPVGEPGRYYRYLTPSVTGTDVSDWQAEVAITGPFVGASTGPGINSAAPSLFYYDETNTAGGPALEDRYVNYPTSSITEPLVSGRGYSMFVRPFASSVLDTRGTLAMHQQVINVTAQSNGGDDGWNLIGNPYPSPVFWDDVTLSPEVNGAIYIPDNSNITGEGPGFVTYVAGTSVPQGAYGGVIDSGQGFWVRATATGTVTFNESDKIIGAEPDSVGQFYRTQPTRELLRVFLTGASGGDELAIRFKNEASDTFDKSYDALKRPNVDLNFFSKTTDGRDLTINTLGALDCNKSIPLSMNNLKEGYHSFKLKGMDSFGSDVDFKLIDNETGNPVDLRSVEEYGFMITSENIHSLANRFVLQVDKSRLLTDLAVSEGDVCFDDKVTAVFVDKTQPEIQYQVLWEGTGISEWKTGNGDKLEFTIATTKLKVGDNLFTVSIRNTCSTDMIENKMRITKHVQPQVTQVTNDLVCQSGEAILQATGASQGQRYNWYASIDDPDPVMAGDLGEFKINQLDQSVSYYVSVKDEMGCESERREVTAELVQYENAEISVIDNMLISNYESGNQWFFNNQAINGATGSSLQANQTGVYRVEVMINGCSTEDLIDYITTSNEADISSLISIYPNPASKEIQVDLKNSGIQARDVRIIDSRGKEVGIIPIVNSAGYLNIEHLPGGMYLLKIKSLKNSLVFKVIKE